jgi:DNA-binding response OmpR family regulator
MGNKVLLVDDDSEILSLVQYALEAAGHQVQRFFIALGTGAPASR